MKEKGKNGSNSNEKERLKLQSILRDLNQRVDRIWGLGILMSYASGRASDDWCKVLATMGRMLAEEAVAMMDLLDSGMCPL